MWTIRHRRETVSTNLDARAGRPGDVFTADYQTAGRGRLDHKWLSPPGTNLMMSAVLSVEGLAVDRAATLPLVVGLAVCRAVRMLVPDAADKVALKWPNDVLVGGRKVAGILCERCADNVVAGIGVNVGQTSFAAEIADRATSLRLAGFPARGTVAGVRDAVLAEIADCVRLWRAGGFAAVWPEISSVDFLKGRLLSVRQTDDDVEPVRGLCGGITEDGSLAVGGERVYSGEAHVEEIR